MYSWHSFNLTFSPLFIKTWRIYSIFNRKRLKVVKISDLYLTGALIIHLVLELILLSSSQLSSAVRDIEYTNNDGVRDHIYVHCSTNQAGLPAIAIIAAEKSALLLFGAIM